MGRIERIAAGAKVRKALDSFLSQQEKFLQTIIAVQQIPAPTFSEADRARYIESMFHLLGLSDVGQDNLHNVFGRFPGSNPGAQKPVIVSAHSDTVFAMDVDLEIRREGNNLHGPGVGDNSTGVAGLFAIADAMRTYELRPAADTWFVSNVGEEGLGNLDGMRAVVNKFGRLATYVVLEGGLFGQISHEAIGVRRFRIEVSTPGGHSWGSFGNPSAIHEIGRIIVEIDNLKLPSRPKTTYNIGVIEGGVSVNTIAPSASFLLDLRSEDTHELDRLVNQVMDILQRARTQALRNKKNIKISAKEVGNRPAGRIPRNTPVVRWAEEALRFAGCDAAIFVNGSTDANIPLSKGIDSVCVGLTRSANSHRIDEYIETGPLPNGLQHLLLLVLAAGNYSG